MGYYYKYNFVSPEGIYSIIREELRSYMDAGVVDDLMFPTYLNKCLDKLGKSSYTITETLLYIDDFTSRLPDNFHAVREAWLCAEVASGSYQSPSSFYSQTSVIDDGTNVSIPTTTSTTVAPTTTTTTTIVITSTTTTTFDCRLEGEVLEVCEPDCRLEGEVTEECTEAEPLNAPLETTTTTSTISTTAEPTTTIEATTKIEKITTSNTQTFIQIIPATVGSEPYILTCLDECSPYEQQPYKVTDFITYSYKRKYLLKPGNISARESCDVNYLENWRSFSQVDLGTPYSSSYDSFDVRNNKLVTNFRKGVVDLIFYATDYDEIGNQLIPDNYRVKEYIEAFIKYKMFEQLMNLVTDETINQIERKVQYYERRSDEAYILALTEVRSQTMWEKQRRIKQGLKRLDRYELPGDHRRNSTWRRNR